MGYAAFSLHTIHIAATTPSSSPTPRSLSPMTCSHSPVFSVSGRRGWARLGRNRELASFLLKPHEWNDVGWECHSYLGVVEISRACVYVSVCAYVGVCAIGSDDMIVTIVGYGVSLLPY